ncbi:MAG TPA: hypothetical protein VES73_13365 [Lamprocystis sp. (in: g-proteobacteria)]|nr:hypothetical protein [Lamprocystis sp. (in: g-proteobacteria)]
MGIYRCNTCGYLAEVANEAVGSNPACPKCTRANPVYDTTFFVSKVLEKYFALRTAHQQIQAELDSPESLGSAESKAAPASVPAAETRLDGIDLHNTNLLSTPDQHRPIEDWFAAKKIAVKFNHRAIDTSGFYDEAAIMIGRDLDFYGPVLDKIRFAQTRGFNQVYVPLDKCSQKEGQAIAAFCRKLYEYSFLAKCFHQKDERQLRLLLQTAPQIRDFFAGEWLEWFVLMEVLELCQQGRIAFSCARNLSVSFPNEDLHELDLFWLVNADRPVCIECKTGEFRSLITKYSGLRKRLGLTKEQFVLCVAGLPDDQASGLSSMYDITLTSERGLKAHLASMI